MNKIQKSIDEVNFKITGISKKIDDLTCQLRTCYECLRILEKIQDDKFIPNEDKELVYNITYLNEKQL
jgi:hypothetical protein